MVFCLFFVLFFNVYFWGRERQSVNGEGRERERQDLRQALGSEPSAKIPTQGLNSQAVRS